MFCRKVLSPWRLEYIVGADQRLVRIVGYEKLFCEKVFSSGNFQRQWRSEDHCSIDHHICSSEWQLHIAFVVIINYKLPLVVFCNKAPESCGCIAFLVFVIVLHKHWYFQKLWQLRKCKHVD